MSDHRRPNLLYIHSDQHNPRVLGCYGDPLIRSPHLDALAEAGVLIEHAYCPSPICVPSRMSTLTGRHPHENRVWTNSHVLSSAIPTMAHSMGAGGYRPVLIGRMHAIGPDQLHGYAQRLVGDHSPNHPGGRPVDHGMLARTTGPARVSLERSGHGQNAYQVHDEAVTEAAVDFLDRRGRRVRGAATAEPFSLSVGFMLPHQPFVARREDYEYYFRNMVPPTVDEPHTASLHPHIRTWRSACGIEQVSASEIHRARAAYWALVEAMDRMIGRILTALRESGLADRTLIVYSSDHGEQLGEHGLWWKQTFYEDSVTVPAIISWPGRAHAGLRLDRVVSSLDLNATILDALQCPPLPSSRGRSLLPLIASGGTGTWDDVAFSEFCLDADGAGGPFGEPFFPREGVLQRMIRRGDWKLTYYRGLPSQLFNLRTDPHELEDRIDDPACADVVSRLTAEVLDGWDPDLVAAQMAELRADNRILKAWAGNVVPDDSYRWDLRPEMDYLDANQL